MRFPLAVDLKETWHKIFILIQFELGSLEIPNYEGAQKLLASFAMERSNIFQHVTRVAKCLTDVKLLSEDAIIVKNALSLCRSFRAKCWEDSPNVLRQLDKIGPLAVKKLVGKGIFSFEDLRHIDAQLIEVALSRNPPFGSTILHDFAGIPWFKSQIELISQRVCNNEVDIKLQLKVAVQSEHTCREWHRDLLFASIITYTEEGVLLDFRRIPIYHLNNRGNYNVLTRLKQFTHLIKCEVSCDEIPGITNHVELEVHLDQNVFPTKEEKPQTSARKVSYEDEELDSFMSSTLIGESDKLAREGTRHQARPSATLTASKQLPNGNWECNHKCKDKNICKHICCREGMDQPSRSRKPSLPTEAIMEDKQTPKGQSTLNFFATPADPVDMEADEEEALFDSLDLNHIPVIDICGKPDLPEKTNENNFLKRLNELHTSSHSQTMEFEKLHKTPQFLKFVSSEASDFTGSPTFQKYTTLASEKSPGDQYKTPTLFQTETSDVDEVANNSNLALTPCTDTSIQITATKRKLSPFKIALDYLPYLPNKTTKHSEAKPESSKSEVDINSLLDFLGPSVRLVDGEEEVPNNESPIVEHKPLSNRIPNKDCPLLNNVFTSNLMSGWSRR